MTDTSSRGGQKYPAWLACGACLIALAALGCPRSAHASRPLIVAGGGFSRPRDPSDDAPMQVSKKPQQQGARLPVNWAFAHCGFTKLQALHLPAAGVAIIDVGFWKTAVDMQDPPYHGDVLYLQPPLILLGKDPKGHPVYFPPTDSQDSPLHRILMPQPSDKSLAQYTRAPGFDEMQAALTPYVADGGERFKSYLESTRVDSGPAGLSKKELDASARSALKRLDSLFGHGGTPVRLMLSNAHGLGMAGLLFARTSYFDGALVGAQKSAFLGVDLNEGLAALQEPKASPEGLVHALQWLRKHHAEAGISVVSISMGTPQPCTNEMEAAIKLLLKQNVVVVAAAGNLGPEQPMSTPANCPGVISVAASTPTDDLWFGSSGIEDPLVARFRKEPNDRWPVATLAAPGGNFGLDDPFDAADTEPRRMAALPIILAQGATVENPQDLEGGSKSGSLLGGDLYYGAATQGTSGAAVLVSAAAAYVLGQHPTWTPAMVRQRLVDTAFPLKSHYCLEAGARCPPGVLDALAAVNGP